MSTSKRPIYVLAHRCNNPEYISQALAQGVNAIECDVRYGSTLFGDDDWYVDHDGVFAWSTELKEWLDGAATAAGKYGNQFALIMFDIKTPEHLGSLRSRVRNKLPSDLNVLYDVSGWDSRDALDELIGDLLPNEGVALDYIDDADDVNQFAKDHSVSNFWYGNGITAALPGPKVKPSLTKGGELRDHSGYIKKTMVWTLERKSSIEEFLEDVKVDAVLVNWSVTVGTFKSPVRATLDIIKASDEMKLARRQDDAFAVFCEGDRGVDDGYPLSIAGNWSDWPSDFTSIDAGVFSSNGKGYFFKGDQYIRYTPNKGVDDGYPRSITKNWGTWPTDFTNIDAALYWPNGKLYFFKGGHYIRYTPGIGIDDNYPKTIADNWTGWPDDFTYIDAAVFWPNGKGYFFKGDQYLRYTPDVGVDDGYPRPIRGPWANWPADFTSIDAAVFWPNNGKGYFFSGDHYLRYTP